MTTQLSDATAERIRQQAVQDARREARQQILALDKDSDPELHREAARQAIAEAEEHTARSFDRLSLCDIHAAAMRIRAQPVGQSPFELVRAANTLVDGYYALAEVVNTLYIRGFRRARDTASGLYRVEPLPNYLDAQAAAPTQAARLRAHPKGGLPSTLNGAVAAQGYRLVRYSLGFVIDEQDEVDMATAPIGISLAAVELAGEAAGRLIPDLVDSVILENPTLDADSTALFHSNHSNLATAALDATALDAADAAIRSQTLSDDGGAVAHDNYRARYLIVPPDLHNAARRLARDLQLDDEDDLIVRSESRLGTGGLTDPRDETLRTGSTTNWLLAASASDRPSIVVSTLRGETEPQVQRFSLEAGRWGSGFQVQFSAAATAVDYRGLYWSSGTA